MFEDFSFLSSSTTISSDPRYTDSSIIDPLQPLSPLQSRGSTPTPAHFPAQCSWTRDMRFDTSRSSSIDSLATSSRRLSIDTLTSQFDNHAPFDSSSNEPPRSAPIDEDEGFVDGPNSDQPLYTSTYDDSFPSSPLMYLDYSIASTSSSASSSKIPITFSTRRRQRQLLSRLQCLSATGQLDSHISMLVEECHPSSLPDADAESAGSSEKSGRPVSITTSGGSTIPFTRASAVGVRRAVVRREPRLRKRK